MSHEHEHEHEHEAEAPLWTLIAAGILFAVGIAVERLFPGWYALVPYLLAALLAAGPLLGGAWEELRHFELGEEMLMVIAITAAFVIGEWLEGAAVAVLFAVGERLEDVAVDRSRDAVEALCAIRPDRAVLLKDGKKIEVAADEVSEGDILYLAPFSRVPVDAAVLSGASAVDTAALTGESVPVPVGEGDALLSGSINGEGELTLRALRPAEDSAAARVLALVEESAARKGNSERFITRFARVYTPVVVLAAVAVAVIPPLFGGGWADWIHRALTFLVASCPCALVLSVPLAFYAGIGAASRRGVLIKGGHFLEALANPHTVCFDKTGTLTEEGLTVTSVDTADGIDRDTALALCAAVEGDSAHPVAAALRRAAEGLTLPVVTDRREIPARGVRALWEGHAVLCGGARLMEEEGISLADRSGTVFLAIDGKMWASIVVGATVRAEAPAAVKALYDAGVVSVQMLTGDAEAPAAAVAAAVGVDHYKAGLLPADKLSAVEEAAREGVVLFVGDGINDAPVLARADVGIAMGLGSAAAIESADAVLVGGELSRLPEAIRLARRVMTVVRVNIGFSLAVKAAVLILAVAGLSPMWLAVFADVGVTLLSVANAAKLLSSRSVAS